MNSVLHFRVACCFIAFLMEKSCKVNHHYRQEGMNLYWIEIEAFSHLERKYIFQNNHKQKSYGCDVDPNQLCYINAKHVQISQGIVRWVR